MGSVWHKSKRSIQVITEKEKNRYKHKPPGNALRQQKLNAWQPIFTPQAVLPSFMVIGCAFIPIGVGLLISSLEVEEFSLDYTNCVSQMNRFKQCSTSISKNIYEPCTCEIQFTLNIDFHREVYFYYGLINYYQNLRLYARSLDDNQLYGESGPLSSDCKPFKKAYDVTAKGVLPIAPCGAIANSLFNDTFKLFYFDNKTLWGPLGLIETGISWTADKEFKYNNPKDDTFKGYTKPPYWRKYVNQLDPYNKDNNGYDNEHLIVWMRVAAFAKFRKLWARVDHKGVVADGLPKGRYVILIEYNYPVAAFGGRKLFIISNTSWIGGRALFLGICYIVFGGLCIILTAVLYLVHRLYGYDTREMMAIDSSTPYFSPRKQRRSLR